jgi:stearoyl-CoA desaturase (delta-9 desaturase)
MTETKPSKIRRIFTELLHTARQWVDNDYLAHEEAAVPKDRMDWKRLLPFIIIHTGCFAVIWVGFSWFACAVAVLLYFARMFAITAFYHRYFSHRTFRTSRWAQFVFAVWGNTAMQRGPLWWAAHHRHHHQHSDDHPDVHSPTLKGFLWSHIGWITSPKNFPTDYSRVKDFMKHREIVFLNRHDVLVPVLYGISLFLIGWALQTWAPSLGTSGAQLFVYGFFISTVALMHGTFFINSLAHVFGQRRFKTEDTSRNSLFLALLTLGEGWHNNHHRYMHSAKQGFYWWEIDVSYYLLKMLSWMGVIWDLRPVPAHIYEEARIQTQKSDASHG